MSELENYICFFAQFDSRKRRCSGPLDFCHLVAKQTLKRIGIEGIWDECWLVRGCRFHHGEFDNWNIMVPRDKLPERLLIACDEHELGAALDRRYGATELF